MKSLLCILFLLLQFTVFSQTNVYYFKDKEHKISLDNIEKVDYITLCF